jgi:hypothetical protein
MAFQAQDIIYQALNILGLESDTDIAGITTGEGDNNFEVSSTDALVKLLNKSQNEVVRYCVPIHDIATISLAVGDEFDPSFSILTTNSRPIRTPITVNIDGYYLKQCKSSQMKTWWDYYDPATSSPAAYCDERTAIILSMPIVTACTATIEAYCYPTQVSAYDDNIDKFIDDEIFYIIAHSLSCQLLKRNIATPNISQRTVTVQDYNQMLQERYNSLDFTDPSIKSYFPPLVTLQGNPPMPQPKEGNI